MYLAQLRWLEGFAAGGRWYVVEGEPREVAVDGLALARARRVANKLRHNLARALAGLVGDVAWWSRTTDGVLKQLGEHLRGHAAGDPTEELAGRERKAARALEAASPRLRPLVRAAASAWRLRPDTLFAALRWMQARTLVLEPFLEGAGPSELCRLLGLASLAATCEAGVDALLALQRADLPDAQQTTAALNNLIRRLSSGDRAAAPPPRRSGPIVTSWIDQLLRRPSDERARILEPLATIDVSGLVAPWHGWERAHAARIERAQVFAATGLDRGPKMEDVRRVIAGIERARAELPPPFALGPLLGATAALGGAPAPYRLTAVRLLGALPGPPALRANFLVHAGRVVTDLPENRQLPRLWEALALEVAAGAPDQVLGPWQDVLSGKVNPWLEHNLVQPLSRRPDVRRLAAALAGLARADLGARRAESPPVSAIRARELACAVAAGFDAEEAVALVVRLAPFDVRPRPALIRAAIALVGREVAAVAGMLRLMWQRHPEQGWDEEALASLCERTGQGGHGWLIRGMFERRPSGLVELVELTGLVPRASWPRLQSAGPPPDWIDHYPPALTASLARLASVDPQSRETTRRRLAVDLAEPEALEREAATLRARPERGERERRRLLNLEARITQPRAPSPARLERLAVKVEDAALAIGSARLAAALTEAARARVLKGLGLPSWPGWPMDRMRWSVLIALVGLPPVDRALAARLLRARTGPPPWDLRDDPANLRFLARLREIGLDPGPWLDDAPRVVIAGDGRPVELALSSDPLEVFAMGAHFGTCLSPEGSNFFSVVTNAADVNKRVLYARRDGKVVGRCLLALTDAGQVLTFHAYFHDGRLKLEDLFRDFATALAAGMGSSVGSRGRVSLLLGRDWYDDGVRDLVGRYQALHQERVADAIQAVAPSALLALLEEALGRPVDDVTLPVVMVLPAVHRRPELIEALAPRLLAQRALPDHTLVVAADLALRHGDLALADRLLAGPAERATFQHDAWYLGRMVARTRPSFTLARLRATRPPGVRRLEDERGDRLAVAALATETLNRPRQALALYRQALADAPWLEDELRPRLEALGAG
jgi:hypothetical protein